VAKSKKVKAKPAQKAPAKAVKSGKSAKAAKPAKAVKAAAKNATAPKASLKKTASKAAVKKASPKAKAAKSNSKVMAKTAAKTAVKKAAPKRAMKPAPKDAKSTLTVSPKLQKAASSRVSSKTGDVSDLVSPLDDRILIRLEAPKAQTASGLYLPDTAGSPEHTQGTVVAIGRGHVNPKGHFLPVELRLGDRVVWPQYMGSKILLAGEELVILRERDVLGILD